VNIDHIRGYIPGLIAGRQEWAEGVSGELRDLSKASLGYGCIAVTGVVMRYRVGYIILMQTVREGYEMTVGPRVWLLRRSTVLALGNCHREGVGKEAA